MAGIFSQPAPERGFGIVFQSYSLFLPAMRITLSAVVLFMRSMVTLAAVIFLVIPSLSLASVTVMPLDEAGLRPEAAAFSTCIMAIVAAVADPLHVLTGRARTITQ